MNSIQQVVPNPRMHAEALRRMGRGPDTQLIHMTDSEIGALNGLSSLVFNEPLRVNPETGLPEAGLFKKLLPTVLAIGAATFLGPMAGAAIAPMFGTAATGGLATGIGAGLTALGGHVGGQLLSGTDFGDIAWGPALMSGVGSGLGAGFAAPGAGAGPSVGSPELGGVAADHAFAGAVDPAQVAFDPTAAFGGQVTEATGMIPDIGFVPNPEVVTSELVAIAGDHSLTLKLIPSIENCFFGLVVI